MPIKQIVAVAFMIALASCETTSTSPSASGSTVSNGAAANQLSRLVDSGLGACVEFIGKNAPLDGLASKGFSRTIGGWSASPAGSNFFKMQAVIVTTAHGKECKVEVMNPEGHVGSATTYFETATAYFSRAGFSRGEFEGYRGKVGTFFQKGSTRFQFRTRFRAGTQGAFVSMWLRRQTENS